MVVTDDGSGSEETIAGPERVGLGNTRARLEALYGDRCRLELTRAEGRGARVTIEIPHRICRDAPPRSGWSADE